MKPLQPFAHLFRFNANLLNIAVAGFSAEDWAWHPEQGGNPAWWILGHVSFYRRQALALLGQESDLAAFGDQFARGSKPGEAVPEHPSPAQLCLWFQEDGVRLAEALESLTEEQADAAAGMVMPDGSDTLGGVARFLYCHECTHLGQLLYLRRAVGKEGIA